MTGFPAQHSDDKLGSDFAELARSVKRAGLLQRRYTYYAVRITVNGLLLAAGGVAFVLLGDSWWQLFIAVFFAVMFTQSAFIGHDAGHQQILSTQRGNNLVGQVHSAITGISYGWWVGKHNQHHANPTTRRKTPTSRSPRSRSVTSSPTPSADCSAGWPSTRRSCSSRCWWPRR